MAASDRIVLDHLAHAAEHSLDLFVRYYGELGGRYVGGGTDPGFFFSQVEYPSGMRLELLEDDPAQPEQDFLRRFLDRNGPGPHHLTFKVPDLDDALDAARAAGYEPVGIDRETPDWQQAFLHPKQAPGIVIQLAQQGPNSTGVVFPDDAFLPPPRVAAGADLLRVTHLVADGASGRDLFVGLLAGSCGDSGRDELGDFVDVSWPSGAVLRLVEPTEPAARQWLGDRSGRIHHVRFAIDDGLPAPAGSEPNGDLLELRPEDNLGLRLQFERRLAPARQ